MILLDDRDARLVIYSILDIDESIFSSLWKYIELNICFLYQGHTEEDLGVLKLITYNMSLTNEGVPPTYGAVLYDIAKEFHAVKVFSDILSSMLHDVNTRFATKIADVYKQFNQLKASFNCLIGCV